jgi:ABC-type nitrate/sulfonate/bicarbonate transport system substrate-binding protein
MSWAATFSRIVVGAVLGVAMLQASAARAADKVIVGLISSGTAIDWPLYIGVSQGFFTAENIEVDIVNAQSSAAGIQQLISGSTHIVTNAGLVDPVRAIEKGAPIAILRIMVQAPPYALVAKPSIKTLADLKGKTIIIGGGAKDVTRIFVEAMLKPHGVKPGEFDMVFAGSSGARFSALQSGAVDAAILPVPIMFFAESAGFNNLGYVLDYLKDMPFVGFAANRSWATANAGLVERFQRVFNKSVAWFEADANRPQAVKIMMDVTKLKQEDVEKAYDFLRSKHSFEPTGKVSKARLGQVVESLQELGDVPAGFDVNRLVLPGVTQVVD